METNKLLIADKNTKLAEEFRREFGGPKPAKAKSKVDLKRSESLSSIEDTPFFDEKLY